METLSTRKSKELLFASKQLSSKQAKDLKRLNFTEDELDHMVLTLVVDMGKRLKEGRKRWKEQKAQIEELKNPIHNIFNKCTAAPPQWASEYHEAQRLKKQAKNKSGM